MVPFTWKEKSLPLVCFWIDQYRGSGPKDPLRRISPGPHHQGRPSRLIPRLYWCLRYVLPCLFLILLIVFLVGKLFLLLPFVVFHIVKDHASLRVLHILTFVFHRTGPPLHSRNRLDRRDYSRGVPRGTGNRRHRDCLRPTTSGVQTSGGDTWCREIVEWRTTLSKPRKS